MKLTPLLPCLLLATLAHAQIADDRPQQEQAAALTHIQPTPAELRDIQGRLARLDAAIAGLRARAVDDDLLVDVEVNARAVHNLLRFPEEFFTHAAVDHALGALDDGLRRAGQLAAGHPAWPALTGRVARAFRSQVDGTPQPYRLMIPAAYDPAKPIALYVYLHGHGDTDLGLNWVGGPDAPDEHPGRAFKENYIELLVFGRANSNYKWSAETDVFQAIASVERRYHIDRDRILLAGFSMGGAGTWQIGLHCPDLFCGLEVDAGVLGTRQNLDGLTPAQRGAAAPYGVMIDHAINVVPLPLVAYAGERDAQLASSRAIRERLATEGYPSDRVGPFAWKAQANPALYLVTPKQGHSHATGDTLRQITAFNAAAFARGRTVPDHVRFVTYTPRYNQDFWITVDGLQRPFERATVDAVRDSTHAAYVIRTENISALTVTDFGAARTLTVDGTALDPAPAAGRIELTGGPGHWVRLAGPSGAGSLAKVHGLQGPINDAFMDSFLCVSPTGASPHPAVAARNARALAHFQQVFAKQYRGDARTKPDTDVTDGDIADHNLILFGDPASNRLIAKIIGQLPIIWTGDRLVVDGRTYDPADHVPVLIYPNPLNPRRYVVLNTGLGAPGRGGDPEYGDFAVLKVNATGAVAEDGGIFDAAWQLPARVPPPLPPS